MQAPDKKCKLSFFIKDTYTGDPSDPLSLNLYTYCHNEPIMYYDPLGHDSTLIYYNNRYYTLQELYRGEHQKDILDDNLTSAALEKQNFGYILESTKYRIAQSTLITASINNKNKGKYITDDQLTSEAELLTNAYLTSINENYKNSNELSFANKKLLRMYDMAMLSTLVERPEVSVGSVAGNFFEGLGEGTNDVKDFLGNTIEKMTRNIGHPIRAIREFPGDVKDSVQTGWNSSEAATDDIILNLACGDANTRAKFLGKTTSQIVIWTAIMNGIPYVAKAVKPVPVYATEVSGVPKVNKPTVTLNKIPHGLTSEQFKTGSNLIRENVGHISDDIVVQGSRASGTAKITSDIDIAIRVSPEEFNGLIEQSFSGVRKPNPGSAKERTMQYSIDNGIIQAGETRPKLSGLAKQLKEIFGIEVDISIIKKGGAFDKGPFINLPNK